MMVTANIKHGVFRKACAILTFLFFIYIFVSTLLASTHYGKRRLDDSQAGFLDLYIATFTTTLPSSKVKVTEVTTSSNNLKIKTQTQKENSQNKRALENLKENDGNSKKNNKKEEKYTTSMPNLKVKDVNITINSSQDFVNAMEGDLAVYSTKMKGVYHIYDDKKR